MFSPRTKCDKNKNLESKKRDFLERGKTKQKCKNEDGWDNMTR